MIDIKDLSVRYETGLALDSISLQLEKGHIIGIIGPNGAGKSTLMKATLNLIPHTGKIVISDKNHVGGNIAYVEQKSAIDNDFPMTVSNCVSQGLYKKVGLFRYLKKSDWKKVDEVLDRVGLLEYKNRSIKALSGGQFQRMLVARCLIQDLDYLFLDEPFVGIDSVSEQIIVNLLTELCHQGKMILVVHHDLSKVGYYFDKLIILNKNLIVYGDTKVVFTPVNLKKAYGDTLFIGGGDSVS